MATGMHEQLTKYLTDAHAVEVQALQQLKTAPGIAGEPELERVLREHEAETEVHERLVRERLEARGAEPSTMKDVTARAGALGFLLFARVQPDTPGKLTAHAFSYEHLEVAAYELLAGFADRAGDVETASVARRIREDERNMAERLAGLFDTVVDASLARVAPDDLQEQLVKYLADAHAIEAQAIRLLEKGSDIAGAATLEELYADHLAETRDHQELVAERLAALGGSPSALKDAALRAGALNWGTFFQAQPDTPHKLAAFAYAFEHLEIAAYELLKRVAKRAGDEATAEVAERILGQEYEAASRLSGAFGIAIEASLEAAGVSGH
jgi:ferritin-like metal-binding protein YciE